MSYQIEGQDNWEQTSEPQTGVSFLSILGTIGGVIGATTNYLSTCSGSCWLQNPPFSGKEVQRKACLAACQPTNTPTQGQPQGADINKLLLYGIGGLLAYKLLSK